MDANSLCDRRRAQPARASAYCQLGDDSASEVDVRHYPRAPAPSSARPLRAMAKRRRRHPEWLRPNMETLVTCLALPLARTPRGTAPRRTTRSSSVLSGPTPNTWSAASVAPGRWDIPTGTPLGSPQVTTSPIAAFADTRQTLLTISQQTVVVHDYSVTHRAPWPACPQCAT